MSSVEPSNLAVERTAGSPLLAAAAHPRSVDTHFDGRVGRSIVLGAAAAMKANSIVERSRPREPPGRRWWSSAVGALVLAVVAYGEMPTAGAQQQGKTYRVAVLASGSASVHRYRVEALRAGLRDLGYVEGKNTVIEFR